MRHHSAAALLVVLLVSAALSGANAGTFTRTDFTDPNAELAIQNTGTLIEANSVGLTSSGGSAESPVTVNGVLFGNDTSSTNLGPIIFDFNVGYADAGLDTLMEGGGGLVNTPLTVTISGLTVGNDYRFQYLNQSTNGNSRIYDFAAEGDTLLNQSFPASLVEGNSVVYEWSAADDTLNFSVSTPNVSNGFNQIAGYALFDVTPAAVVPEPSAIAMWSLLGLGLSMYGYRRFAKKNPRDRPNPA